MKSIYFATLFLIVLTLAVGDSTQYKSYSAQALYFSDNFTVLFSFNTVTIYNNLDLSLLPQTYQTDSQISLGAILSNQNLLFGTTESIYILNPTNMSVINQSVLSDRVYATSVWGGQSMAFAIAAASKLYYLDPATGNMTLLDSSFSTRSDEVLFVNPNAIMIVNAFNSTYEIIDSSGNLITQQAGPAQPLSGAFETPYQLFGFAWGSTIQFLSSVNYNSLLKTALSSDITDVWMPSSDRVIVITINGRLNIYSADMISLGYIAIPSSTVVYDYIQDGLIAIFNSNSTITLFNISETSSSSFYYGKLTVPNSDISDTAEMIYLQGSLFALISMYSIYIFDYQLQVLATTLTFDQILIPSDGAEYIDGTFFIPYYNQTDPFGSYFLSTCHCSCATCSGFGPNSCTSCSPGKQLNNDSSCTWANDTCDASQDFCFVCESMLQNLTNNQSSNSQQNNSSSSTNSSSNSTSSNTSNSSSSSNSSTNNTQTISTAGTGQTSSSINNLTAVNVGAYATMQLLYAYMKKEVNIFYMLKLQGINTDGQDSCSDIKSAAASQNSTTNQDDQPIIYQSLSTASYQPNSTYVISLYGLRGSTDYEIKVCADTNDDTDYLTLDFETKNINYKIASYSFCLDQQITTDLVQDLLCFLANYLSFPGNRIYSIQGIQCNQLYVGLMASTEVTPPQHRRILQAASSSSNSNSSSNQVGVLLYGNPNTETTDTSVDQAVAQLSSVNGNNLRFQDRTGNYVSITSMIYQGDVSETVPALSNDIIIATTSNSVALSNIIIENMRGYIYAMLATNTQAAPTQDQIKSSVVNSGNATNSTSNGCNYWYYDGTNPVQISFNQISSEQEYIVYYFASNEDITNFAFYSDIVSKTVQTGSSTNIAMVVTVVVLSLVTFLIIMTIIICYIRRRAMRQKAKRAAYKASQMQIKMSAKIVDKLPIAEIMLQDLKDEKEALGRIIVDLENSQNVSKLNLSSSFDLGNTEGKDILTPGEFAHIRKKVLEVEKKIKNFEKDKLCPICMEHQRDLLLGCGHLICSEKCGKEFSICPFDQTYIQSRKRIYQEV